MPADLFSSLPNPLLEKSYAVIDFETTGLYPAVGDEICEVALARLWATTLAAPLTPHSTAAMPLTASKFSGIQDF